MKGSCGLPLACARSPGPRAPTLAPTLPATAPPAVTTRLSFRKGKGSERIAKLIDSPTMPEADAVFEITAAGIQSPE